MRYAALKALILIILGIIFTQYIPLPNVFILTLFLLSLICIFFTKGYSLYLALFLVSILNYNNFIKSQKNIEEFPLYNTPLKIQAQIIETPIDSNKYSIKLIKVNNNPLSGKILLYIKSDTINRSYGDVIEFNSTIIPFDYPRNFNLIDYNKYFHKQGYLGSVFINSSEIKLVNKKHCNWFVRNLINPVRQYFFETIDKYLDGDAQNLLIGMLLGEKRGMSKSLRKTFADTGVAHILAVSGLHVGILIGVILLLLPIFRIKKYGLLSLLIIIITTIIYLCLTGFKTSAVRASIMVIFYILGFYLERRYESLNGIFVAAIIILLISPQALTDISFQLSFSAATAIVLITPRLYNKIKEKKMPKFIKNEALIMFFVSFSAFVGTAPLILYYFFQLPLLTIIANMLIVPLVGFAMPLGLLILLFNLILPFIAEIYSNTLWFILNASIFISNKFANFSYSVIEPGRPSMFLIFLFYLAVLSIIFWNSLRFRKISLAVILTGLNIFIWHSTFQSKNLSITFLDTKQGDAIYFELPNGRNMLIDAGEENEIVPQFLKSKGTKKIDIAVITHPHLDHYGGYCNLIDVVSIRKLLIATDQYKNSVYTNLICRIKNKGTKIYLADQGQTIDGLSIKTEVLSPNISIRRIVNLDALKINDISIVLKLTYSNTSLLLPGDLDDVELLDGQNIQANILKSPHHGSKKANSQMLFSSVHPQFLIITGRKNISNLTNDMINDKKIQAFNIRKDGSLKIDVKTNQLIFNKYNNTKLIFNNTVK